MNSLDKISPEGKWVYKSSSLAPRLLNQRDEFALMKVWSIASLDPDSFLKIFLNVKWFSKNSLKVELFSCRNSLKAFLDTVLLISEFTNFEFPHLTNSKGKLLTFQKESAECANININDFSKNVAVIADYCHSLLKDVAFSVESTSVKPVNNFNQDSLNHSNFKIWEKKFASAIDLALGKCEFSENANYFSSAFEWTRSSIILFCENNDPNKVEKLLYSLTEIAELIKHEMYAQWNLILMDDYQFYAKATILPRIALMKYDELDKYLDLRVNEFHTGLTLEEYLFSKMEKQLWDEIAQLRNELWVSEDTYFELF